MIPPELADYLGNLSPRGVAAILAALAKLCPRCEERTTILTSEPAGGGRKAAYCGCRSCGWRGTKLLAIEPRGGRKARRKARVKR